jgi:hypothetical protein
MKSLNGRDNSQDLGVDGDNIKIDIMELWFAGGDCYYLAQNRDCWRPLLNTVEYLVVP